ncbi:MAG: hypothetical protein CM15mP103_03940 [Gammaproteobacteria bacterium]|nr:MAG: hypothetical protein CM15mP103_03940 [Gammaproteobacteria bacterium]
MASYRKTVAKKTGHIVSLQPLHYVKPVRTGISMSRIRKSLFVSAALASFFKNPPKPQIGDAFSKTENFPPPEALVSNSESFGVAHQ